MPTIFVRQDEWWARFALPDPTRRHEPIRIPRAALRNPVNAAISDELFRLALPDAWIVSGCLVQTVWNGLTHRALDYGINDYDVFYFDPDTSWAAEDAVIRQLQNAFAEPGVTVEARNQARVHLWYPDKHGLPYPALRSSTEGIDRFLTKNTRVGIRRTPGWSRRLCARRLRRYRRHDRAAESRAEFFGGELRGEGGALEEAVAGDHGAAGGVKFAVVPAKAADPYRVIHRLRKLFDDFRSLDCLWLWVPAFAGTTVLYRTTPEVNPALRRGGLMSFFRKQRADLPA